MKLGAYKGVKDVPRLTASVVIQRQIPTISNARKGLLLSARISWNLIRLKYRPVEQKLFSIFSFLDKFPKFVYRILHPCTNQEIAQVLVAQPLAQFRDLRKNAVLVNTFSSSVLEMRMRFYKKIILIFEFLKLNLHWKIISFLSENQ